MYVAFHNINTDVSDILPTTIMTRLFIGTILTLITFTTTAQNKMRPR